MCTVQCELCSASISLSLCQALPLPSTFLPFPLSYTTLSAELQQSVTDGSFNTLLNYYAIQFGCTGLQTDTSYSVTTQNLEQDDDVSSLGGGSISAEKVDDAAIGGISVAVLVFACLAAVGAYFAYLRHGKAKAMEENGRNSMVQGAEMNSMNPVCMNPVGAAVNEDGGGDGTHSPWDGGRDSERDSEMDYVSNPMDMSPVCGTADNAHTRASEYSSDQPDVYNPEEEVYNYVLSDI
jgi:hypothetical protein